MNNNGLQGEKMNYQYWQEISSFLNDFENERKIFEKNATTPTIMETTRTKITSLIEVLKSSFEQRLDKFHATTMLFPIVAMIDEKMQGYEMSDSKIKWMPLQKDYYAAHNAGEIFYKSLDEMLDSPNIPNIIYQVYYSMLKMGFQGKYKDSKTHINKYLDLLKDKIPIMTSEENKKTAPDLMPKTTRSSLKKWHCYALALLLAATTCGLLFFIARLA